MTSYCDDFESDQSFLAEKTNFVYKGNLGTHHKHSNANMVVQQKLDRPFPGYNLLKFELRVIV